MKKLLVIVPLLVVLTFIQTTPLQVSAAAKIQSWYLVDSGKHLDYAGNSLYMGEIRAGVSIWNAYKKGVIRKDNAITIQDVYISDKTEKNDINATTYPNGKILFNKYNMKNLASPKRINVATHELGHALGLDHNTSADIMYKFSSNKTSLSSNDKASYNSSYKRY